MSRQAVLTILLSTCVSMGLLAGEELDLGELSFLPVQSGGRVMPGDTFARVSLLNLSGKSSVKIGEQRLSALDWLARVLFKPLAAREDAVILVESAELLDAMGLAYEKERERYSFAFFEPGIPRLRQLANAAFQVESSSRDRFERQTIELYGRLAYFEGLLLSFGFLQPVGAGFSIPDAELGPEATWDDALQWYAQAVREETQPAEIMAAVQRQLSSWQESLTNGQLRYLDHFQHFPFSIFPHPEQDAWQGPWMVYMGGTTEQATALASLRAAREAYRAGDANLLSTSLRDTRTLLEGQAEDLPTENLQREVRYNRLDLFFWANILYVAAMLCCAFSWLGKRGKAAYLLAAILLIAGFAIHSYGMFLRIQIKGRPPVTTLYESMLFVAWVGVFLALLVERVSKKSFALFGGSLLASALLFVASRYASDGDHIGVLVAVLDSNFWLSTHVTTVTIGYGATLFAAALAHAGILMHLFLPDRTRALRVDLRRMLYGVVCFALVFSFVGTVLGGIWADQSWGRFWGWDPKENGALLIVLWNAFLLHGRMGGHLGKNGMAIGCVLGGIITTWAWWGVNLLNTGLHSYGFDDGIGRNLMLFIGAETLVIALGFVAVWIDAERLAVRKSLNRDKGGPSVKESPSSFQPGSK